MKAALLAFCLAGCASVPDGSVVFTQDEMMTMATNFAALQEKVRRLELQKVPLCNEVKW